MGLIIALVILIVVGLVVAALVLDDPRFAIAGLGVTFLSTIVGAFILDSTRISLKVGIVVALVAVAVGAVGYWVDRTARSNGSS